MNEECYCMQCVDCLTPKINQEQCECCRKKVKLYSVNKIDYTTSEKKETIHRMCADCYHYNVEAFRFKPLKESND